MYGHKEIKEIKSEANDISVAFVSHSSLHGAKQNQCIVFMKVFLLD